MHEILEQRRVLATGSLFIQYDLSPDEQIWDQWDSGYYFDFYNAPENATITSIDYSLFLYEGTPGGGDTDFATEGYHIYVTSEVRDYAERFDVWDRLGGISDDGWDDDFADDHDIDLDLYSRSTNAFNGDPANQRWVWHVEEELGNYDGFLDRVSMRVNYEYSNYPNGQWPNLKAYQPSGWTDDIVISNQTNTHSDSAGLLTNDNLYVDFAWTNAGNNWSDKTNAKLYVDGALVHTQPLDWMAAGETGTYDDYSLGTLSAGIHTVQVVLDEAGSIAESNEGDNTYAKTINVISPNADPNAAAGPDQTAIEGSTVYFDATGTSDSDGDPLTYTWDFGDANDPTPGSGPTPNHSYADDGAYQVTLTVSDGVGGVDTDTLEVIVTNAFPTVSAGSSQSADEGAVVSFAGWYTDLGVIDTHTIAWDFGDGEVSQGSLTPTHAYSDDGVYPVTLSITDDNGDVGTDTITVTVQNLPPQITTVSNNGELLLGETAVVNVSATDASGDLPLNYEFDFDGDEIYEVSSINDTASYDYSAEGVYPVNVRVSDGDGGEASSWTLVQVGPLSTVTPAVNFVEMPVSPVLEDAGVLTITASLSHALASHDIVVPLNLTGTATASIDYTIGPYLYFPAGAIEATVVLDVTNDSLDEPDETVNIAMGIPINAELGSVTSHSITLIDDDLPPTVSFVESSQTSDEGTGQVVVAARIDAPSGRQITVPVALSGTAESPSDYGTVNGATIVIEAGRTIGHTTIAIEDDSVPEANETIVISMLEPTGATLSTAPGTTTQHTILIPRNDAPVVSFVATYREVDEDVGTVSIAAQLSTPFFEPIDVPVAANWETSSADPSDLNEGPPSVIHFARGQVTSTIDLGVFNDTDVERLETVALSLDAPPNAVLGPMSQFVLAIRRSDFPTVSFVNASQSVFETDESGVPVSVDIEVVTTNALAWDTYVPIAVYGGSAEVGSDYTFTASTIEIPAHETTGSTTLWTLDDSNNEPNKTVNLMLGETFDEFGNPVSPLLGASPHHSVTLRDDDPTVRLYGGQYRISEDGPGTTMTATLSAESNKEVVVSFSATGTARPLWDYEITPSPYILNFMPGETEKSITVNPVADSRVENTESVTVTLFGPTVNSSRTVEILDSDTPTVFFETSDDLPIVQGWGPLTSVVVQSSEELIHDLEINLLVGGTAIKDVDYRIYKGDTAIPFGQHVIPVTIPYGERSASVEIYALEDDVRENVESVVLTIPAELNPTVEVDTASWFEVTIGDIEDNPTLNSIYKNFTQALQIDLELPTYADIFEGDLPTGGWSHEDPQDDGWYWVGVAGKLLGALGSYFDHSKVFLDVNKNQIHDFLDRNENKIQEPGEPDEPSAVTANDGSLVLRIPEEFDLNDDDRLDATEGWLVAIGGTNTATNLPLSLNLLAPPGYSAVTPISTLVSKLNYQGHDLNAAEDLVQQSLGLPDVFLRRFDPYAEVLDGNPDAPTVVVESAKLFDTVVQSTGFVTNIPGTPHFLNVAKLVWDDIADRVSIPGQRLELSSPAIVESILLGTLIRAGVTTDGATLGAVAQIIAASNQYIDDVSVTGDVAFLSEVVKAETVAQGTVAPQLALLASGDPGVSVEGLVAAHTGNPLALEIASASVGTIIPSTLSISDARVVEGDDGPSSLEFTVSLNGSGTEAVSVDLSTLETNSASVGIDYQPHSETLTWEAGNHSPKTIEVPVLGDEIFEADETILVQLTNATGASILDDLGIGTIVNDDALLYRAPDDGVANEIRLWMKDDYVRLSRNSEVAFEGSLSAPAPITIIGAHGVENTLVVDIRDPNAVLGDGLTFLGGDLPDDKLVIANDTASETVHTIIGPSSGNFDIDGVIISYTDVEKALDRLTPTMTGVPTYSIAEGATVSLESQVPDEDGIFTYAWLVIKDGDTESPYASGSTASFDFTPHDDGEYTVSLTIAAPERPSGTVAQSLTVLSIAPTAAFGNDGLVAEGGTAVVSFLNQYDPSAADTATGFRYAFDLDNNDLFDDGAGDGTYADSLAESSYVVPANLLADDGTHTVRGRIIDKDGGYNDYTTTITIANVDPTANPDFGDASEDGPAVPIEVLENDTDPAGENDPLLVTGVDTSGTLGSVSFTENNVTYDPNGAFDYLAINETATDTFSYSISDGDGGTAEGEVQVKIIGANDIPDVNVTDVTGSVVEMVTPVGELTEHGTIGFTDDDLTDRHIINNTVIVSPGALGFLTASVTTDTFLSGSGGVITWNYSVPAVDLEYLASGETKVETFNITLDDGNDGAVDSLITITITGTDEETSVGLDVDNNLLVRDISGGTSDDTLTVSVDGANVRVHDPNQTLQAETGAIQIDLYTVEVPLASILGPTGIIVDTLGGDDSLTVLFDPTTNLPAINYRGGTNNSTGPGDELVLQGVATTTAYSFSDASSGSVDIDGQIVTYDDLEPITSTINATNVTLSYSDASETISVSDATGGQTTVNSTAGETVTFNHPTGLLSINAGDAGANTINVGGLATSFPASLDINGGNGGDTANLNGAISFAGDKSLSVDAATINLPNTSSDVATSGDGAISLNADRNISLSSGSSLTTDHGDLTLNANMAGKGSGDFVGIEINDATVQAIGAGPVSLHGQGGNDAGGDQYGVWIQDRGEVIGGTSLLTVVGLGGSSTGRKNHGVYVLDADSQITSSGGNVLVDGSGGGSGSSGSNYGVFVSGSSAITAGGSGTVTVSGTGGSTLGEQNHGVYLDDLDPRITSGLAGGNVSVTGTGGGAGDSDGNTGVYVGDGEIGAGGSGTVTVAGNGGNQAGTSSNNRGVFVSGTGTRIASNGGDASVTGTSVRGDGVFISSGEVTAAGNGTVHVVGNGGGFSLQCGIRNHGTISSEGGNIIVAGAGGNHRGVDTSGEISAGGIGTVTVIGNRGNTPGTFGNTGVYVSGRGISSTDGDVSVTGNGDGGSAGSSFGVWVGGFGVQAGGTGNVTVIGNGGSTTGASGNNYGVYVTGKGISSADGNVSVTGTGGSSGGHGVSIIAGGEIMAGGSGTVTVLGTGGNTSGTGGYNFGVYAFGGSGMGPSGARIGSADGDISVTGIGGGSGTSSENYGIYLNSGAEIISGGNGAVTVSGIGGNSTGTGSNNGGVYIGANSTISSPVGDLTIGGTGGGGSAQGVLLDSTATIDVTDGNHSSTATVTVNGSGTEGQPGINIQSSISSDLGTVALVSEDHVEFGTAGSISSDAGVVSITGDNATGNNGGYITMDPFSQLDAGTGNVRLQTDGPVSLGVVSTTGTVSVESTSSIITETVSGIAIADTSTTLDGMVSPASGLPGTFDVDGNVTFAPTAGLEIDIDGTTPATEHDQLVVYGDTRTVDLGGAQLNITLGTPPAVGSEQAYTIIDSTDAGSGVIGVFKDGATDLNDGDTFDVGTTVFRINYLPPGDVVLTEAGNTPPAIDVSSTSLSYTENAPAIRDGSASASDDQANWDGGSLAVQLTANAEPTDQLSLLTVGNVTLVGADVKVSGVTVGTTLAASVTGADAMTITFNINATNAAVEEVVQAIGFDSTSEDPSTAQRTVTFTLTDDLSESSSDDMMIDVSAVNDDPVIGLAVTTGGVTEITDGAVGENATTLSDSGTIDFSDVDLNDGHSLAVVETGSGYRGTLAASVTDASTGDGEGQVTWTFEVNDAALDNLAAGQTRIQRYEVMVDDGNGGSDTEAVTITITGTNDSPVITSQASDAEGSVAEAGNLDDGTIVAGTPVATGTLTSTDVDADATAIWSGDTTSSYGGFAIDPNSGVWTYALDNNAADELDEGDVMTETFVAIVTDDNNATATETVTITINGTNDAPVIGNGETTGSVTEIVDGAVGENTTTLSDGGTIAFTDVDLDDSHTVAVVESGTDYRGTLMAGVTDASTGDGAGQVTWTYQVDDAVLDDLAAGQTLIQEYEVSIADGPGASDAEIVTITITGTNDAPTIDNLIANHDLPCESSADGTVTISGTFSDVDLLDTHTVSVDWGDGSDPDEDGEVGEILGSVDQINDTFDGSHTYETGGMFVITVTVDDGNGGADIGTATAFTQGVGVVDGTLYVIGTGGKDIVSAKLIDGGSDGGPDNPRVKAIARFDVGGSDGDSDGGAEIYYFDPADIQSIYIVLCDGDDHATLGGGSDGGSDGGDAWYVSSTIDGGAGKDKLTGGGGNDTLIGRAGNDKLKGNGGDDVLLGGDGKDHLDGGNGNDVLSGGTGNDKLYGRDGRDILIGGDNRDKLKGGKGDDLLIGGEVASEDDLDALDKAIVEWVAERDPLSVLGDPIDDLNKDDLNGEKGVDLLFGGVGDKVKQ